VGEPERYIPLALTLAYAVACGGIGFIDDYCKLIKKQNEGLSAMQKLVLLLAFSSAYLCVMSYTGNLPTAIGIPFTGRLVELGWWYYLPALLILGGVVNGGNITDGIDGLASSITFVIGGFYSVWAFAARSEQLSMIGAILIGASLGFLVYNFHPARVFMGDTGSLFFGALTIGASFMMGNPLVGLVACAVFVLEMLSSLLQFAYFRITHGKRLFKMAPVHHHFEKCGWSEVKIVVIFTAVTVLFCVLAWFGLTLPHPEFVFIGF
jgi:phospho-N-acetylmuramoyl-pentapeptide-transferase